MPEDHPLCQMVFRWDNVGGLGEYLVCHCKVSFVVFLLVSSWCAQVAPVWPIMCLVGR